MPTQPMHRSIIVSVVISLLALAGCGGSSTASLVEAAGSFTAPSTFTEQEVETLNGFEDVTRRFTFTTDLSQREACDLAAEALQAWADQPLPEPVSALPRNLCSYELRPANHATVDFAAARVFRAKHDGEFIEDATALGGVESITIVFRQSK